MRNILVLFLAILALAACSSVTQTPMASSTPGKTSQPESTSPIQNGPTDSDPDRETPATPLSSVGSPPLDDNAAAALMYDLTDGDSTTIEAAIETIIQHQDQRFIAVFLELFRANQIGIYAGAGSKANIDALEALSGVTLGNDWPDWVEWYGAQSLSPPPGFVGWKGALLSELDPRFGDFLKDEFASNLRPEEIMWGGVLVDGIPALDNPEMIPANEADYLLPEEPVFGISISGDHQALPLRILDWHEMANIVVGDVPVSLAYCTLCGAGIAFDGRAASGETFTFGSSGFLYRSNKLMYDRQTNTLWNQLTGEPVLGPLVGSGITLKLLPVVLTSWADWQTQHPDSLVLSLETGYQRAYYPGAAYGDYFSFSDTMFPVWQRSDLLETKARIFALRLEGIPKAYPVEQVIAEGVINDQIGDTPVVLIGLRGEIVVNGIALRAGEVTYNAGGEVRAFERGENNFVLGDDLETLIDEQGQEWQITEENLVGPDGALLPRLGGHLAYWFGWFAFFPNTLLYGIE